MKTTALCICLFTVLTGTGMSAVFYVHPESTQNNIQTCLNMCSDNDTVLVGPGTYIENIVWPNTDGINLISEFGRDTTVIDGDSSGAVVNIVRDSISVFIRGFTIRNGADSFGGIRHWSLSTDTIGELCILDNAIVENTGSWCGGIFAVGTHMVARGNIIRRNRSDYDAGVSVQPSASVVFEHNLVDSNYADTGATFGVWSAGPPQPGGIGIRSGQLATWNVIRHNDFVGNTGGWRAAAIHVDRRVCSLVGNRVVGNDGGLRMSYAGGVVDSNTVVQNRGFGVSCWDAYGRGHPDLHYNSIAGNYGPGLYWDTNDTLAGDAEHNWWGDSTGPYHDSLNPGGRGDSVVGKVDFDPWLRDPPSAVVERRKHRIARPDAPAAVVRGALLLDGSRTAVLLDVSGRRVMNLEPGPNDIRHVAAGIYFLARPSAVSGRPSAVSKVIVTR